MSKKQKKNACMTKKIFEHNHHVNESLKITANFHNNMGIDKEKQETMDCLRIFHTRERDRKFDQLGYIESYKLDKFGRIIRLAYTEGEETVILNINIEDGEWLL